MIHGFARQNGGVLQLESAPGQGTRAHIWLPVAEGAADARAPRADEDAGSGTSPIVVLVVDDDPLVLMNTAALLEDAGHEAIEAETGVAALEILRQRPEIALLVTDQAMPGMTGSQLITAARAMRPDLPVILATGYGETPADSAARMVRLNKPFNQSDLNRAVAEAALELT